MAVQVARSGYRMAAWLDLIVDSYLADKAAAALVTEEDSAATADDAASPMIGEL